MAAVQPSDALSQWRWSSAMAACCASRSALVRPGISSFAELSELAWPQPAGPRSIASARAASDVARKTFIAEFPPLLRAARLLLRFLQARNHAVAGSVNRAVFVDGENQGTGEHGPEIAASDDLVALDFVGAIHGVGAEGHVGFAVFELGVDRTAGVAIFAFGAAAAPDRQGCASQNENQKRIADRCAIHKILLSRNSTLWISRKRPAISCCIFRPRGIRPSVAVWPHTVLQF